jgi:hypothetical protein
LPRLRHRPPLLRLLLVTILGTNQFMFVQVQGFLCVCSLRVGVQASLHFYDVLTTEALAICLAPSVVMANHTTREILAQVLVEKRLAWLILDIH